MKSIVAFIISILLSVPAMADFEFYRGVRQMGMGGASIAVVNDETAVLANPNGLGKLRDYFFTLIDPEITGSTWAKDPLVGTAVLGAVNPESTYEELQGNEDKPMFFKTQIFPSIVLPNFGFGLLANYEVLAQRNGDGTYEYNYRNDFSLNLAYNLRFWGGRIKLGFAGRLINRNEFFGTRDPSTESLESSAFFREGMGVAVDTGLTLAAPWIWLPTLSVLVRDVGHTSFTMGSGILGNGGNGTPRTVEQQVDVAVAVFPIFSKYSRGTLTMEYANVMNTDDTLDTMDRLRIGAEFNFVDLYFVRAGYYQNSWTAGFEYAYGNMQWQLATYAERVIINTVETNDRRAMLKFALRF